MVLVLYAYMGAWIGDVESVLSIKVAIGIIDPRVTPMQTIGLAVVAGLLPFLAHWLWPSERSMLMYSRVLSPRRP